MSRPLGSVAVASGAMHPGEFWLCLERKQLYRYSKAELYFLIHVHLHFYSCTLPSMLLLFSHEHNGILFLPSLFCLMSLFFLQYGLLPSQDFHHNV